MGDIGHYGTVWYPKEANIDILSSHVAVYFALCDPIFLVSRFFSERLAVLVGESRILSVGALRFSTREQKFPPYLYWAPTY